MVVKLIKTVLLLLVLAELAGCAPKVRRVQADTQLEFNPVERRPSKSGETVWLMQVVADNPAEKLVLKPATYPNGVYVCALENLGRPCLPKLSAQIADALAQKGIVISPEQSSADATLYFETWFDSFSASTDRKNWATVNPTLNGRDFAAKIERSLETGNLPEVHKRFRDAPDPFTSALVNANDEQKFIYFSITAIEMDDTVDFPGDPAQHLGPSKNPWLKPAGSSKKKSWFKPAKRVPASRTLLGNYNGEAPTEMAVFPMLRDGVELLVDRIVQTPPPVFAKKKKK